MQVLETGSSDTIAGARVILTNAPGTVGGAARGFGAATAPASAPQVAAGVVVAPAPPTGAPTVVTSGDGIAVFDRLPVGSTVAIRVEKEGYFASTTSGNPAVTTYSPVEISTATVRSAPTEVVVTLSPAGSISGRALDPYGVPFANARIQSGSVGYRDGRRTFIPQSTVQSDGYGNYTLAPLHPGEYYLRIEPSGGRGGGAYFPGTAEIDRSIRVPVETGQQVVGIDFKTANIPVFKVSGNVLNVPVTGVLPPNGNPAQSFTYASADPHHVDTQAAPLVANFRGGSNGEFEVGLPSGLWDLFPVINMRPPLITPAGVSTPNPPPAGALTYATGRVRVFVGDHDVENVIVKVTSSDIQGHFSFQGATPVGRDSLRVRLLPVDETPVPLISHLRVQNIDASGKFEFKEVPPGRYRLQFSSPANIYLADIRIGSKSAFDDGIITVDDGPVAPIEVTFRSGGGRIEVAAPVISRTLPEAVQSRLVLLPAAPRQQNILLNKVAVPRPAGLSTILSNVSPGDYKIFAFEDLPAGGAEENEDFMAKYQSLGTPVHVEDGRTTMVQVQWIPVER